MSSSVTYQEKDRRTLKKLRAGEQDALDQLYLDALLIIRQDIGAEPRADKFLQDALLKLRQDITRAKLKLQNHESLAEYLARMVRERWEQHLQEKELDQKIINTLTNDTDNGWAFYYMQRYFFPSINYYIRTNGGSEEDAKDIIMDSIYALLNNIKEGKYKPQDSAKLKTYFFSICKNKWKDHYKKRKNSIMTSLLEGMEGIEEETPYYVAFDDEVLNERQQVVAEVFKQANEKCHRILSYFYYDNLSHTEIAERMGYEGPNTSKEQKKRCMNKIRTAIVKKFKDINL